MSSSPSDSVHALPCRSAMERSSREPIRKWLDAGKMRNAWKIQGGRNQTSAGHSSWKGTQTVNLMLLPSSWPRPNAIPGWNCHWLAASAISSWKITQNRDVTPGPASSVLEWIWAGRPCHTPAPSRILQPTWLFEAWLANTVPFPKPLHLKDRSHIITSAFPVFPAELFGATHRASQPAVIPFHSLSMKSHLLMLPNDMLPELAYGLLKLPFLPPPSELRSSDHPSLLSLLQTRQVRCKVRYFACSLPSTKNAFPPRVPCLAPFRLAFLSYNFTFLNLPRIYKSKGHQVPSHSSVIWFYLFALTSPLPSVSSFHI